MGNSAGHARRGAPRPGPAHRSAALLAAGRPSADALRSVQRSAGNAAAAASMAALPVQRASAYVATGSRESQTLADKLKERHGLSTDPKSVKPGEILWIIGHGSEIGDGTASANEVRRAGFRPGGGREVRLVVCNAGRRPVDAHAAPAQNIANILQTPVHGSTAMVMHVNGGDSDIIEGKFRKFMPQNPVEDITSRMSHLSTRDAGPTDELTSRMGQLTLDADGWSSHNGAGGSSSLRGDGVDAAIRGMRHLSVRDQDSDSGGG
ncbi:hypothetical protein ACFW9L_38190 [Streptomyces sp. NPDC059517]|uniref:hypothetical protein n=1 Tax=Streptomyces sp. NPDC059517 TaxID=3346855 RepID=UPI00367AEBD1